MCPSLPFPLLPSVWASFFSVFFSPSLSPSLPSPSLFLSPTLNKALKKVTMACDSSSSTLLCWHAYATPFNQHLLWNIQPFPNIAHSHHTCKVLNCLNISLYHHITFEEKKLMSSFFPHLFYSFEIENPFSKQLPNPYYTFFPDICHKTLLVFVSFRCSSTWLHVPLQSAVVRQLDLILTDEEVTMWSTPCEYILVLEKIIEHHGFLRYKSLQAS